MSTVTRHRLQAQLEQVVHRLDTIVVFSLKPLS